MILGTVDSEEFDMSGLKSRVLTAVIAIPVLLIVVLLFPQLNHLAFCLMMVVITLLGTIEMRSLLSKDHEKLLFTSYSGALLPLAQYIQFSYFPEMELTFYTLMFLIGLTLFLEVFFGAHDNFRRTWERNAKTITTIIYPGLFASFIIRIAFIANAAWYILFYFLLVFGSDTFAFFFGILFGKNNKGIIKVSPNKSVAGYLGGLLIPAVCGLLSAYLFPEVFTYSLGEGFVLGLLTSAIAAIGDLIESSFKRSAEVKDSGSIIPGRGGILDSIDSVIMAAPVYVAILTIVLGV